MLDSKGFDKWSGDYDENIRNSYGYPFDGYYEVLKFVQNKIEIGKKIKILDLGVGTGELTRELYKQGVCIYGVDFSSAMIERARQKMSIANFYYFDFNSGLPKELENEKFEYIVSSYAFHHIDNQSKIEFITKLKSNLKTNGRILLADVAFETRNNLDKCKKKYDSEWDSDEFYMIGNDMVEAIKKNGLDAIYTQISMCAGVLEIFELNTEKNGI